MRTSAYALLAPTLLSVAAGCTAPVVDDDETAVDTTELAVHAVVVVEQTGHGDDVHTNVSAKFMRLAEGTDPSAAELILTSPLLLPEDGTCATLSEVEAQEHAVSFTALSEPVELLDVGDVSLRLRSKQAGAESVSLSRRAFPDVADLVSGVFYTSPSTEQTLVTPAPYALEGSGGEDVDGFVIDTRTPAPPEAITIGDAFLLTGQSDGVELAPRVALVAGSDATIRWSVPGDGDGAGDSFYVDLLDPATAEGVRCGFADVGEGAIPGSFLTADLVGRDLLLSVHRVTSQGFTEEAGISHGEIRFDVAVVGSVSVVDASRMRGEAASRLVEPGVLVEAAATDASR